MLYRYAFRHRRKVNEEHFNTLPFFIPQKELHPVGRPFAHVLSAG
jgi:hypothetical protein